MLKSSKKDGFALIEVICALAILCVSSAYICEVNIKSIQLKNYNESLKNYIDMSENLENILKNNYSYKELDSIFENNLNGCNGLYIDEDNLNIKSLKNVPLKNMVSTKKQCKFPYAKILLNYEEQGVMKVTINLNFKNRSKIEKLNTYFYKGDY